ncbi:hypothetical protein ACQE3E_22950 [Methylomonas sp. MED-D]|uniref:5'-methylthioadenosine/S-adenosylhomocysteine nucleosidase family protein n=1 Tax=unclassified Methylomonas TaxID=2608980 RepID=UPI0028A3185B|nr:hypothetical protein [Methylomonas sp. MV1]MDT4332779.1 hypothetical protein [Methylomonas sp. MV1]
MTHSAPYRFVFTALACEAKPLIRAWSLKKTSDSSAFSMYSGPAGTVVVSGIGKTAMAGAVAYALALRPVTNPVLLNLGVAGHPEYPIGHVCLADKVVDADTGRCFFPQLPFDVLCPTASLITSSKPNTAYLQDALYDMEASAFYETAVRFGSSELIHCLKIVSDNPGRSIAAISEIQVESWIGTQVPMIENVLGQLQGLRRQIAVGGGNDWYDACLARWHFSVSNAGKLKNLLARWDLLTKHAEPDWDPSTLRSAADALNWLENKLAEMPFSLRETDGG